MVNCEVVAKLLGVACMYNWCKTNKINDKADYFRYKLFGAMELCEAIGTYGHIVTIDGIIKSMNIYEETYTYCEDEQIFKAVETPE